MNQGGEGVHSLITRTNAKPPPYGQWNPLMSSSPPVQLCNELNWCLIIWCKWLNYWLVKLLLFSDLRSLLYRPLITGVWTLPAQYTDTVDLKDWLLHNRVCTVKFPVVESFFLVKYNAHWQGHQPEWPWRFGDSNFMIWYFTAQVLFFRSQS